MNLEFTTGQSDLSDYSIQINPVSGLCYFCGKETPDVYDGQISYHTTCFVCPQCGSDFIIWQHKEKPFFFRCQKCLNGWER